MRELYLAGLVFLGSGVGGTLRYGVYRLTGLLWARPFPLATFAINVGGSLALGLLTGWFAFRGEQASQPLRLLLTTGLIGGFTTFSTFSLDTALLSERGQVPLAAAYVMASVAVSVAAVFAGMALVRAAAQ